MCASVLHVHCSVVSTGDYRGHYLQVISEVSLLKLELMYMRGASSLFSKITDLRGFHNFTSHKNTLKYLTCNLHAEYHVPSVLFGSCCRLLSYQCKFSEKKCPTFWEISSFAFLTRATVDWSCMWNNHLYAKVH